MSDDGSMARLPEIINFAKIHNLKVGTVSDLIKFKLKKTKIVKLISERPFESEMGSGFSLKVFQNTISGEKHYALVKNLIGSEIKKAFELIETSGSGAIVLINSDMSPI